MIALPVIAVMAGRYWPFLVSLPVVMVPICGKTVRQLYFGEGETPALESNRIFLALFGETAPPGQTSWDLYIAGPLILASVVAVFFAHQSLSKGKFGRWYRPVGLVVAAWTYFWLNNAFFHSPWPWKEWTGRTANGLFFLVSAISLTLAAMGFGLLSISTDSPTDERHKDGHPTDLES